MRYQPFILTVRGAAMCILAYAYRVQRPLSLAELTRCIVEWQHPRLRIDTAKQVLKPEFEGQYFVCLSQLVGELERGGNAYPLGTMTLIKDDEYERILVHYSALWRDGWRDMDPNLRRAWSAFERHVYHFFGTLPKATVSFQAQEPVVVIMF